MVGFEPTQPRVTYFLSLTSSRNFLTFSAVTWQHIQSASHNHYCWAYGIRTHNARTKILSVTVTPKPNLIFCPTLILITNCSHLSRTPANSVSYPQYVSHISETNSFQKIYKKSGDILLHCPLTVWILALHVVDHVGVLIFKFPWKLSIPQ